MHTIKNDKILTELNIENALITYLNGNRLSIGYDPIYGKKRLVEKYGIQYKEILNDINTFLSKFPQPNWETQTYYEYLSTVEKYALERFEWITPTLAKAITNYFAYQWR